MEKRHITENDYPKIIDICEQILRGGDFEKLRQELVNLYRQIIELQPPIITPSLSIIEKKKEAIEKSRKTILSEMIEAAKNENNRRLVYLLSILE